MILWRNRRVFLFAVVVFLCCTMIGCSRHDQEPAALRPFLSGKATVAVQSPIHSANGEILRYDISLSRGSARAWVFPDGSVFWCEESTESFELDLSGFSNSSGKHLNESDLRSPFLAAGSGKSALIQPPLARALGGLDGTNYLAADQENGTISKHGGKVTVEFDGACADWWAYLTPSELSDVSWLSQCTVEKFGDANRMTKNGYYYKTPSNYIPSGENSFYLLPAAHISGKLAHSNAHHANQMAVAMLDIQSEHYNQAGFIPTYPASDWLSRDYGVGAGFYDTRFNTDIAYAYWALGKKLRIAEFTDVATRYARFFADHAKKHGFATQNGILAEDYSHPNGNKPTHTSLNHQLAEVLFLLEVGSDSDHELAYKLLAGIEDTAMSWIREDNNLHYAYYPDGTFGGTDYPYLTYNDLFALDRYLGGNEVLRSLMDAKRAWMDECGITEYVK